MPDVLVIGGGVAGLATAAWCRSQGVDEVVVVERGQLAGGPSGRAAGALIPEVHALTYQSDFAALARRGLALHGELHERWGTASTLRRVPARVVAPRADVPVELPDQGLVDPTALAVRLAQDGGTSLTGVDVTGWQVAAGRVTAVRTSAGTVRPAAVVVATGRWPDVLAAPPALDGAVGTVKGHLVATAPLRTPLEEIVVGDLVALPGPGGRVIVGGTFDVDDADPAVRTPTVDAVRAALGRLAPAAAGAEITHAWTCFRPTAGDGLPIVDRVPGIANAWVVAGLHHTGVLTAPAIAESLASWIASGTRPDLVAPFALDRVKSGT